MDFASAFAIRKKRRFKRRLKRPKLTSLDRVQLIKRITLIGVGAMILGLIFIIGAFAWFSRDLPSPDRVVRRDGFSTQILSRDGDILFDVYNDVQREPVDFNQVPQDLKNATIAVEDKNFYSHEGFDPVGMSRAVFSIIFKGRLQGGSTLTQQLVKNVLLTSERTLPRKFKEFVLAVQIEKKFTKDEILQMYLQEAPYGGASVGVGVASRTYFSKSVNELNLVESAFLAGMPQAPTRYSPYGVNPTSYVVRTTQVLRRMQADNYITKEEQDTAEELIEALEFKPPGQSLKAPHFVMYVRDLLTDQFGDAAVESGGLKVTTTLDLELQQKAQEIVAEEIEKVSSLQISNGAALIMDTPTGEILSMVGSKDFSSEEIDGQVNVTLSSRQPGSAIKPVTYAAAFRKGYTPSTMIVDSDTEFDSGDPDKPYQPVNYDGKLRGPVQLRFALGSSLNIPSVKLLQLIGLKNMLSMAHDLGFTTLEPTTATMRRLGLSVTLGGGEVRLIDMVGAYSAFSNGGTRVDPIAILKVENSDGKVIFEHHQTKGREVLSPQEAFLINHILSDNNARLLTFGSNSLLNMGSRPVAVKTGTTNDLRDNWAVGWSRRSAVGSWVGNNDNSPMKSAVSGVSGATPIWRRLMLEALSRYPSDGFTVPSGVMAEEVDVISGFKGHDDYPTRAEYFIDGTIPDGIDPIHTKIQVCKSDGKLAGPVEIAKGDAESKEFIVLKAPSGLTESTIQKWQEGIDEWIGTQEDGRYRPPTEKCESGDGLIVQAVTPTDQTRINNNDFDWEAKIITDKTINKVEIFVDGTSRQTLTSAPWRSNINLSDGTYTLKLKARVDGGQEAETDEIRIGINRDWDYQSPTPTPSPLPTATP